MRLMNQRLKIKRKKWKENSFGSVSPPSRSGEVNKLALIGLGDLLNGGNTYSGADKLSTEEPNDRRRNYSTKNINETTKKIGEVKSLKSRASSVIKCRAEKRLNSMSELTKTDCSKKQGKRIPHIKINLKKIINSQNSIKSNTTKTIYTRFTKDNIGQKDISSSNFPSSQASGAVFFILLHPFTHI